MYKGVIGQERKLNDAEAGKPGSPLELGKMESELAPAEANDRAAARRDRAQLYAEPANRVSASTNARPSAAPAANALEQAPSAAPEGENELENNN